MIFRACDCCSANRSIQNTFTANDVVLTTPSGVIDESLISVTFENSTTFTITFPLQHADGNYSLAIGPDIADTRGNLMEHAHTAAIVIDQTGPKVILATPNSAIDPPLSSFDITFDSVIDETTFSTNAISLRRPDDTSISPYALQKLSLTQYRASFSEQSMSGSYTLMVGRAFAIWLAIRWTRTQTASMAR